MDAGKGLFISPIHQQMLLSLPLNMGIRLLKNSAAITIIAVKTKPTMDRK
jgi:hypothetical protein